MRLRNGLLAFGILTACAIGTRAQERSSEFEVASVRIVEDLNTRTVPIGLRGGPGSNDPDRLTDGHATLQSLLWYAYDLDKFRVFGPGWTTSDKYDVVAKVPSRATPEQARVMMQNLIKERFVCQVHFEKRNISIYELTIAKNGPRLMRSLPSPPDAAGAKDSPTTYDFDKEGLPRLPPGGPPIVMTGGGPAMMMAARKQPLSSLITFLQGRLNMIVVDKTGLVETYDFAFKFGPPGVSQSPSSEQSTVGVAEDPIPDVVTALEKYLGLKLEQKRVALDVLVIDHAERTPKSN